MAAPAWARYTVDGIPWIAVQPPSSEACIGQDARTYFLPALGYWPLTITWRHDGVPIAPGLQPWGSTVSTNSSILTINNVMPQDRGQYDAVVSTACGSVNTAAAAIVVNSADFNGDGDIGTDADIEAFFACLAGNCCAACGTPDFNADGDVGTDADIEAFFRVLAGGSC